MQSANFKIVAATLSKLQPIDNTNVYAIELLVNNSAESVRVVIASDFFGSLESLVETVFEVFDIKSLSELTYCRLLKEEGEEQYSLIANIVGDKGINLKGRTPPLEETTIEETESEDVSVAE